jgi:hypothetical protein
MILISRSSDYKFFDKILEQEIEKQSCCFDRVSDGYAKKNIFEDIEIDFNVWEIQGNKLMRKKEVHGETK